MSFRLSPEWVCRDAWRNLFHYINAKKSRDGKYFAKATLVVQIKFEAMMDFSIPSFKPKGFEMTS